MSRKIPIRTYQRKNIPTLSIKIYNSTQTDLSKTDDIPKKQHEIDNIKDKKISEDSLNYDPFETTFDRIAKDAVVPPIPFDCNDDKSWYDSSFDKSNEKKQQNESLFHVTIGTPTAIINPDDKYVTSCVKISSRKKYKEKKKKNYIAKGSSKSNHTKGLTPFKEEDHIEIKKKRRKVRKVKEKENKSNNIELYFEHTINSSPNEVSNNKNLISTNSNSNIHKKKINVLNYGKSKPFKPLSETTNILNTHDKKGIYSPKSMNKKQKLQNKNASNYSCIPSKSCEVSYLPKHFQIKPCSVILNKDNIKEWELMHNKSKNIAKGDNNNALNDSVNITFQSTKNDTNLKENLICSTPITTSKKRLACSILCSPINTAPSMIYIAGNSYENTFNSKTLSTLHTNVTNYINASVNQSQQTGALVLDQKSVINPTGIELHINDNILCEENIINNSLSSKNGMIDIQKLKLSHLGTSGNSINFINNREKYDTIFMDDSIDLILRQNNKKTHLKNNLLNVLNTSVETNRSRSLFNDSESKLHSLKINDDMSDDKLLTSMNVQKSNADNNLKLELPTLDVCNDDEIIKSKMTKQKEPYELVTSMKEESIEKSIKNENEGIEDGCNSELHANQNQSNVNEINVIHTQIQDSVHVTKRRVRVYKRNFNLSDIHENENDLAQHSTSKISQSTEKVNAHIPIENLTKNIVNTSTNTVTHDDNKSLLIKKHTSFSPAKRIFLKPGKCWARSLSILHNFQNGLNLDDTSVQKGRKWRYSVQSILNMQKNDPSSSDKEADKNIDKLQLCNETQSTYFNELTKKCNTDRSILHKRFTRRISVRVVRDSRYIQKNNDDISFLEVYGICTNTESESVPPETTYTTKYSTQCNDNTNRYSNICSSKTAKEVVLQRCSQKNYLSFRECFPQTYLKHCQKIGEGVYGEVFLYKEDLQKSVLKIIPIEGDQLVNGEPQKKFSEILSEIVIAKELHNLRFSKLHNTSGFVEVKSIKCIKGKYPKEMINLWKHYDNEKTSDNDCPSMFNENQLYIAFELGHGGQELEAFEFYTACEAHYLFIQTALALAVAEKSLEFEHRDLHWGNILISQTNEQYIYYKLDNKDIYLPSHGVKVCIIDFTLSRMLYQGCCIFNDLALDPVLFTAQGEYQFEIYRLMRDKIENNWQEYEPYTNILWLHYILDKMITMVRYKKKNLKKHNNAIIMLQKLKEVILSYQSAFDFVNNCDQITSYFAQV